MLTAASNLPWTRYRGPELSIITVGKIPLLLNQNHKHCFLCLDLRSGGFVSCLHHHFFSSDVEPEVDIARRRLADWLDSHQASRCQSSHSQTSTASLSKLDLPSTFFHHPTFFNHHISNLSSIISILFRYSLPSSSPFPIVTTFPTAFSKPSTPFPTNPAAQGSTLSPFASDRLASR